MISRVDIENQIRLILSDPPPEPTWLDYKLEFHKNKAKLLHDIICLANARHDGTRYLIFGVRDKTLELEGIQVDLDSAQIDQILSTKIWNFKPALMVGNLDFNGKRFGYIAIEDQPFKPYFLRKYYKDQGEILHAGTIYTRHSDTNTPYKDVDDPLSVEDGELEHMFRERFGLDKTPLERMTQLLLEPIENWMRANPDDSNFTNYYHVQFPEFQVRLRYLDYNTAFTEAWLKGEFGYKMGIEASYELIELFYNSVLMHTDKAVEFDNRKKRCLAPSKTLAGKDAVFYYEFPSIKFILQNWFNAVIEGGKSKYIRTKAGNFSIPVVSISEIENFARLHPFSTPPIPINEDQDIDFFIENQKKLDEHLSQARGYPVSSFRR